MNGRSPSTSDPAVDSLLASIREAIVTVTGSSLVGLYLFGSLTIGDFDTDVSDVDLIAVLAESPSERLATHLSRMHAGLAQANPEWDDRIEVIYISTQGLANCRTDTTNIAVISPGEDFHVVEAGRDWILNWYPARENGGEVDRAAHRLADPADPGRRVHRGGTAVPGGVHHPVR